MIYTCYSYKGGVGRSMALANIAELLYAKGLRVLMIDFDLEAPGLEQYFYKKDDTRLDQALSQRGIIDLMLSYKNLRSLAPPAQEQSSSGTLKVDSSPTADLPADETFPYSVEPLKNFIWEIHPRSSQNPGELLLMPAGRRKREIQGTNREPEFVDEFAEYADHVRAFGWDDFYLNWDGEYFFNSFYEKVLKRAQVVLIDSRTGVAEMSGVCTYQLADVVVMFVAPNNQNIDGTKKIASSLVRREDLIRKRYKQRKLSVIFVPSRVDSSEKEKVDDLARRFREVASTLASPDLTFEVDTFTDLTIPYIPYYSFVEELVALDTVSPAALNLKRAYENICRTFAQFDPAIKDRMSEDAIDPSRVNVAEQQDRLAEYAYSKLDPDEQQFARSILTRLVRVALPEEGERKDTAKDIKLSDLTGIQHSVAELLEKEELVVLAKDTTGQEIVGLAEEGLIQNWSRLKQWIDEDREFLTWRQNIQSKIPSWEKNGKPDSDLLPEPRLMESRKWLEARPLDLSRVETQYLRASIALPEERTRQRRLQAVGIVLGIMLVSVVVYYVFQKNKQLNSLNARSRQLASNSEALATLQPELSALLAIEAARVASTSEAQQALKNVWVQSGLLTVIRPGEPVYSARFSHDGKRIVTAGGGDTAQIWQQRENGSWENLVILRWHLGSVRVAVFSPDDQMVAAASGDGTAILWNSVSGQMIGSLKVPESLTDVDWSPDGKLIAASTKFGQVYLWEVSSQKLLRRLVLFADNVNSVAFSPDGGLLAAASSDPTQVHVWTTPWEGANFAPKRLFHGHQDAVLSVRFSPDSKLLVSASRDKTARVWSIGDVQNLIVLTSHLDAVTRAAFSPDGKLIVTASEDSTAIVWETASANIVTRVRGGFGFINDASFSPDGKQILTGGGDGTARLWVLNPSLNQNITATELAAAACARLTRNLTPEEWQQYMGNEPYRATCTNIPLPQATPSSSSKPGPSATPSAPTSRARIPQS